MCNENNIKFEKGLDVNKHKNTSNFMSSYSEQFSSDLKQYASTVFLNKMKKSAFKETLKICSLENISRRFLKKCKFCGYKKRSCFLHHSPCKALEKTCYKCGKEGHFPKSMKCKAKKQDLTRIIQLDGACDESDQVCKGEEIIKEVLAANCEIEEVSVVANFL